MKRDYVDVAMVVFLYTAAIFLAAVVWWLIFGVKPVG